MNRLSFGERRLRSSLLRVHQLDLKGAFPMADAKDKMKAAIDNAAEKAKELGGKAVDKTKDAAVAAGEKMKEAGQKVKDAGK
jgi:hypothetical protein